MAGECGRLLGHPAVVRGPHHLGPQAVPAGLREIPTKQTCTGGGRAHPVRLSGQPLAAGELVPWICQAQESVSAFVCFVKLFVQHLRRFVLFVGWCSLFFCCFWPGRGREAQGKAE